MTRAARSTPAKTYGACSAAGVPPRRHIPARLLALLAFAPLAAGAAGYETPPQLAVKDLLPAEQVKSASHEVLDPVDNDGFMNTFHVASPFGRFDVEGRALLGVRLREIGAMAQLSELSKSEVFADAVKAGVRNATVGQVETLEAFAERPVETLQGVPAGVSRMFKRTKAQAKEAYGEVQRQREEQGDAEEGGSGEDPADKAADATKNYAVKYFGVSSAERRWAQKLGVDPYTSNEQLRAMISVVARVDAAGRFGVRFLGIPGIPGIGTVRKVNDLVWETDPYELKLRNQKLLAACGADEETARRFFENHWLSPTLQTAITNALESMSGVEGRAALVAQAAAVESETAAWFVTENALLAAWYHAQRTPIARLLPGGAAAAAVTADGRAVILAATDHVVWTGDLEAAATRFKQQAAAQEARGLEVGFAGTVSPRAVTELGALGYTVSGELAAEIRAAAGG
jgi:hypothetical protein